jgi:hypothetical protein
MRIFRYETCQSEFDLKISKNSIFSQGLYPEGFTAKDRELNIALPQMCEMYQN